MGWVPGQITDSHIACLDALAERAAVRYSTQGINHPARSKQPVNKHQKQPEGYLLSVPLETYVFILYKSTFRKSPMSCTNKLVTRHKFVFVLLLVDPQVPQVTGCEP